MVDEDRTQARIDGLLQVLRDAEADFRRSYARVLEGCGTGRRAGGCGRRVQHYRPVAGRGAEPVQGEAKARADQAGLLTPRRSLTGEVLPPALPATAWSSFACDTIFTLRYYPSHSPFVIVRH